MDGFGEFEMMEGVTVENLWADEQGVQWCFLIIGDEPYLACETDV